MEQLPSGAETIVCNDHKPDASDDACAAQLSWEHNGTEFPIAFLSHYFTDTQQN